MTATRRAPRVRRDGLIIERLADETLVYDLHRDRAHCLNRPAALVWSACDGRRDAAAISRHLRRELPGASVDMVELALASLARARLLEGDAEGAGRRDALRRLALAAGLVPIVSSIVVPEPAQAATCGAVGACCNKKADCCPGLNCVGPRLPQCPPAQDKSCR
jgi:hypothetical protein